MLPTNATEDEVKGCNIFLSVCKPLGSSVCPTYPNSTTCQQVTTVYGDSYYYDMGTYTGKSEFNSFKYNGMMYTCMSGFHLGRTRRLP